MGLHMQNDKIDFERVISDPSYRRRVMEQLKTEAAPIADDGAPPTSLPEDQA